MTKKKTGKDSATTIAANSPDDQKGELKAIGGSQSDHWNNTLANQAMQALWVNNSDGETRDKQYTATVAAMVGIAPKDELEGMMATRELEPGEQAVPHLGNITRRAEQASGKGAAKGDGRACECSCWRTSRCRFR